MRRIAVVVCVGAVLFAACGKDDDPAIDSTPKPTEVTVTATDFAFSDAPTSIDVQGLITLTLKNDGAEDHEAAVVKIVEGKTVEDLKGFFAGPPAGPPPFAVAGGLTATAPGTSASVTQALPSGSYAFICYIPSASDGKPHFAKGMLSGFTVTGNSTSSLPLPEGVNATGTEYSFDLPALKAGTTTIRFANSGKEDHVLGVARVTDGKTADDALNWLNTHQGPPPLTFMGGPATGPGGRNSFRAKFSKGTYVFYCPVPAADDATRTPHYGKGMFKGVTIT